MSSITTSAMRSFRSRGWGGDADIELSQMVIDELKARGLAHPSEDGVSIPLHPTVPPPFWYCCHSSPAKRAGDLA